VNFLRDRCRGRKFIRDRVPVVSRYARDHRLPYVTPSGVGTSWFSTPARVRSVSLF